MTTETPQLHFQTRGSDGPRVAFVHGLFGQGKNWTGVAKSLQDAARVTLIDLPNHGKSAWTEHFSYPDMAHDVAALLENQGGGASYSVVGHSMGGKVAMMLALLRPELVERLCVVDVSPAQTSQVGTFAGFVAAMRAIDLSALPGRAEADRQLAPAVPDPGVRSFLLQNLRRSGSGWRWQLNLELLGDRLDEMSKWPDMSGHRYPGPVLWIAGSTSDYVRPEHAAGMRELFPRARLVTIKNAGHWVHSEQPDVFRSTIRRFLHLG